MQSFEFRHCLIVRFRREHYSFVKVSQSITKSLYSTCIDRMRSIQSSEDWWVLSTTHYKMPPHNSSNSTVIIICSTSSSISYRMYHYIVYLLLSIFALYSSIQKCNLAISAKYNCVHRQNILGST